MLSPNKLRMNALRDVRYRLYAVPVGIPEAYPKSGATTTNGAHQHEIRFRRRLQRGECFSTSCLGLKDFPATYWGPVRDEGEHPADVSLTVPSMLVTPFGRSPRTGAFEPIFDQDVGIFGGVLSYRFDGEALRGHPLKEASPEC
jgi:CRISPR-associated protein Cas5d